MKVRMQRKKERIYPLRGLIYCEACGSRMHPKSNGVDSKHKPLYKRFCIARNEREDFFQCVVLILHLYRKATHNTPAAIKALRFPDRQIGGTN